MTKPQENRHIRTIYIALVLLFLLHLLPLAFKEARMWGFNHLIFLPGSFVIVYIILGVSAVAISSFSFSQSLGEKLSGWFSAAFYESPRRYYYRMTFLAMSGLAFALFPMRAHFLGDGYALLTNLGSGSGTFVKWSEQGITLILQGIQFLLGGKNPTTGITAFRIVSIISGLATIWFYFLIAELVGESKMSRILIFFCSLFSGSLLLFFGYIENYPLLWPLMMAYIYFSLRYLKSGTGLILTALSICFGLFIHLQMAVFFPSFIYLLLSGGKIRTLYKHYRMSFWCLIAIGIIFGFVLFAHKYTNDLYFENMFLPLLNGKPIDGNYAILSLSHFFDLINLFFLLSPLLPLLIYLSLGKWKMALRRKETLYLLLLAVGSILFVTFIDPTLGMARDWDLFSLCAIGLTILLLNNTSLNQKPPLARFLPAILIYLFAAVLPYLIINIGEPSSLAYTESFIKLDKAKSFSSGVVVHDYYVRKGDSVRADSVNSQLLKDYPDRALIERANDAIGKGQNSLALQLTRRIRPDKFSAAYHDLVSAIYYIQGYYDMALDEINKAILLQQYNAQYYFARATVFRGLGHMEKALNDLRMGYALNNSSPEVIFALSQIFYSLRRYDSAAYYGEKMITLDSNNCIYFYFLARSQIGARNRTGAQNAYANFVRLGSSDSLFISHNEELLRGLKSLEKGL